MDKRRRTRPATLDDRLRRATPAQLSRLDLAEKRIRSILTAHGVANHRTLEQKIADAGPTNQRINPHVLATAYAILGHHGELTTLKRGNSVWLSLRNTRPDIVRARLAEQLPIWLRLQERPLTTRVGQ